MPEMVTPEELALINQRFAKEPMAAAYCIPMMAADTERLIDDRALRLHETTIAKFARDANERGPNFQLAHWTMTQPIPLGKVFAGVDGGGKLFTKAYMPVGVTVPNMIGGEFKTDEIAKAYSAGLADRVSIGFSFERAECNVCFEDIRSPECPHDPGKQYETDGGSMECTPVIFAGEKGMLHEISLVPQGALDNAKTVKRSELPMGFAATEAASDVFAKSERLPEVSFGQFSIQVGKIADALDENLIVSTVMGEHQKAVRDEWMFAPEWFEHPVLGPAFDRFTEEEWKAFGAAIEAETLRLTDDAVALALEGYQQRTELEGKLAVQSENLAGLLVRVESLSKMADLGKQYCDTLKAKAIETGIKCMGNAFKADFYTQVFSEALEKGNVDVVTAAIEAWDSEFKAKTPAGRQTKETNGDCSEVIPATPDGRFDYLVRAKLKAEEWPFDRYGDAAGAVGREHPELVAAMRAQAFPHAE